MHERRQKSRVEQDDTPFCLFPAHVAMCISIFLGLFFVSFLFSLSIFGIARQYYNKEEGCGVS